MTKVTVSTWVTVKDGPRLSLSNEIEPETVAQSTLQLDEAGGTAPEQTAELLASGGRAVLLALTARTAGGEAAEVTLRPVNGSDTGDPLPVSGGFAAASPGLLDALVTGGPRSIVVTNTGSEKVTVRIVAARAD
ncbi:hypothetical protein ACO0LV_09935 [Pseudactinotalea sp. Z1739]|uniref:hypothetical protein n=1 Tax=Pseudactinotalea sp. Z1739 TaxID=3413028 RepID=UPI003C7981BE